MLRDKLTHGDRAPIHLEPSPSQGIFVPVCLLPVSASWITCQIAKPAETPDPRGPFYSKGWTNTMDTIPFLPDYAVVAAFRRGFFSCLENWNADSAVGLGNSLLNNSCHKLLPPFPKLAAIWGTATGLRIQENQDFFIFASFLCVTSHK